MKKVAKSPDRYGFQKEAYIERALENGKDLNDPHVQAMIKMHEDAIERDEKNVTDTEWQKNNMEFDMRSADWMVAKVRESRVYAQNLYAALCNNTFQKHEVWPILKNETWSCSWRYAGGIVADMRGEGDYIDWYCSGIGNKEAGFGLDGYTPTPDPDGRDYVPEGVVTEEIELDLNRLGWRPVPYSDDELHGK